MSLDAITNPLLALLAAGPLILRLATLLQPILVLWLFPDVKRVRTGSVLGYSEVERAEPGNPPAGPPGRARKKPAARDSERLAVADEPEMLLG